MQNREIIGRFKYFRRLFLLFMLFAVHKVAFSQENVAGIDNLVRSLFFDGLKEKQKENYTASASFFDKILVLQPNNDAALYELATVQFKNKNLVDAEMSINRAIAVNKSNPWYYKLKADILTQTNNLTQLVLVYDALIKLEPENDIYYLEKAKALYMSSRMDEVSIMYAEFEKRFGITNKLIEAQTNMTIEKKESFTDLASLENMLKERPEDYSIYISMANLYLQQGMAEEALQILEQGQLRANNHFELALAKAIVYRMKRSPDLALDCVLSAFNSKEMNFDRKFHFVQQLLAEFNMIINKDYLRKLAETIVELHPKEPKAFSIFGDVLVRTGKLHAAMDQYNSSLKLNDQNFSVWEKLISLHVSQYDYEAILGTVESAISSFPNQAILYYYREFAKSRLNKPVNKGDLEYAISLDPDNKQLISCIYGLFAENDYKAKKFNAASQWLEKAFEEFPNNAKLLDTYAYFLAENGGDLALALSLVDKALLLDKSIKRHQFTISKILLKMGDVEMSKKWIRSALTDQDAENPMYLEHYGDVMVLLGRENEAIIHWEKAKLLGRRSEKLNKKGYE